ncbi:Enoyl-[acyl-carrier-protein] reductase [NADH] [Enhydrobacter aerosaccus]|uniref:Enoyl-[acyl-carrier-protein] reductase [NADH] n=1 Tax=Enhydrobacter aerosaccus TaxID=225324 RepID=A0A1T4SYQ5_9HYPH|nr:SDR family oxidoreductase [Enhydrobacter aerosaccus]SKA33327.1 Enoyl-[acyl-carrier-protein] reductase [NADH] [Enhydrobacter aerosaccus]
MPDIAATPLGLLAGKRGLIMGLANERSLAWGIAKIAAAQGATLAFSYPNEAVGKRVRALTQELGKIELLSCDVASDEDIDRMVADLGQRWQGAPIDFVVHAISYSDKNELLGPYVRTSRSNFTTALDISCYSFTAVAQRVAPLMTAGGSLLTLTYYGAERVVPNYNVMGVAKAALEASVRYLAADLGALNIRVNAISAGPIKTLASNGISGMRHLIKWAELNAPLKRNTTIEDVGRAALSLISDLGQGITGEIVHVDNGYNIIGMLAVDEALRSVPVLTELGQQVERQKQYGATSLRDGKTEGGAGDDRP